MNKCGLGIAVIGAGYWGKNLVRVFHQLGALRLVCDTDETCLERIRQAHPDVELCTRILDACERPDITAVVIASPAETHFEMARACLLTGKHVFVEKPLALDPEHGEELSRLAREGGLGLMVGHLLQYHPAFIRLRELVAANALGRLRHIYSHRLNLGKNRREENILWSFAPHDISMILSLAGEMPAMVRAVGGTLLGGRVADVTTTHLEFTGGVRAHVFVSWLHPFKEQKLVVVGEDKMAVFDDTLPWASKLTLYPHHVRWEDGAPVVSRADGEAVPLVPDEPLRREAEAFLDLVGKGLKPPTDDREGLRVLRVLRASQVSLESGGVAVRLRKEGDKPSAVMTHPTAVVDPGSDIGPGTKIWHFSHVLRGSRIGADCTIGQNVAIGPDVVVGDGCKIQNNVSLYKGVTLEGGVFCGPSMVFTNVFNPRAHIRRMDELRPTLVRRGATLGANSTIVCGLTVGRYAMVGAGAVVTRDVLDHALVLGNPARQKGWVCSCGVKLADDLCCPSCGLRYGHTASGLAEESAPWTSPAQEGPQQT